MQKYDLICIRLSRLSIYILKRGKRRGLRARSRTPDNQIAALCPTISTQCHTWVWNVQIGILAPFHTLSAFNHGAADNPFELDLKRIKEAACAGVRAGRHPLI